MKHQTMKQARLLGDVKSEVSIEMTATQRLERWVQVLEADPERVLLTLLQTETLRWKERDALSIPGSAISVAYADPLLRREGLRNDTYGEAKRFFEISDYELHRIVCSCRHGRSMSASTAARAVRQIVSLKSSNLFSMLKEWFRGN